MSGRSRLAASIVALAAAFPAVALAQQHGGDDAHEGGAAGEPAAVAISATAVDPSRLSILVGDRVGWVNASLREHTVTSRDGLFDSPRLRPGGRFGHVFPGAGSFSYYCRIHPSITGTVDVAALLLRSPGGQAVRGEALVLTGRAQRGSAPITIERDAGSGFTSIATAAPAADGAFEARLTADASAAYRAVSGGDVSPPVRVDVVPARTLSVSAARRGRLQVVHVSVTPALPGGKVHLQRVLRERFGWWTIRARA